MPPEYKYFNQEEVEGLNAEFVAKLDQARHIAGIPFRITSGFRSVEKNESIIGAVADSAHTKGLAVDLAVENSHEVFLIVDACNQVGINRIGIYVNKEFQPIHIHIDVDLEKIPKVVFIKQEASNG